MAGNYNASNWRVGGFSCGGYANKYYEFKRDKLHACVCNDALRLKVARPTFADNNKPMASGSGTVTTFEDVAIASLRAANVFGVGPHSGHFQWQRGDDENATVAIGVCLRE